MPDSPILDVNELPVVRFENIPRVQLSEAVVAHNLPIRSAWEYFAFDSRAGEGTTKDRHNSASAFRDVTYFYRWSDLRTQFEYKCQFRPTDVTHQNVLNQFYAIFHARPTNQVCHSPAGGRRRAYFVTDRLENFPCFRFGVVVEQIPRRDRLPRLCVVHVGLRSEIGRFVDFGRYDACPG